MIGFGRITGTDELDLVSSVVRTAWTASPFPCAI